MKIIGIVGSSRDGNTLNMVKSILNSPNNSEIESEIIHLKKNNYKIELCEGCLQCEETGKCHIDDDMNMLNDKLKSADAIILGTPAMYSCMSGNMKVFLDRTNPLCKDGYLKGKKAIICAVGQCSEEEESVQKALKSLRNYCDDMEMNVISSVIGFNLENKDDLMNSPELIEKSRNVKILLMKTS